jgi:hypothetical protein
VAVLTLSACASIGGGGGDDDDSDLQGTPDGGEAGSDDVGGGSGGSGVTELFDVAVPGTVQWTDTGIDARVGEHFTVTATGSVEHGGGSASPDGDQTLTNFGANIVNCVGHASLIGRVGALGDAFFVGADNAFAATASDRLFLGINDTGVDNNAGGFAADVATDVRHTSVASRSLSVPGTVAWTDTGLDVASGQQVTITASGTVIHSVSTNDGCDPTGEPGTSGHGANIIGCPNHASLIGKIGDAGAPFYIGRTYSVPATASGRLFLGINDSDLGNNGGSYSAAVAITAR